MDKKNRVLHVVGSMNQGGTENFLMNVYRNIDKEKIQFDFLVNRKGFFDDEIEQLGGKIYQIPALQEIGQIKYVKNLDNFFKQHKDYKIIHSHINQVTGLILERANKFEIPVRIAHSHGSQSSKNLIVKLYKNYLGKKIQKNANQYFACSELAAKWLFKEKSKDAVIIKNGIEIEKFIYSLEKRRKIRNELKISDSSIVIGNVARFSKVKNHDFLIDIFYEYQKNNSNSYLVLVGDGALKIDIQNKVEKLGIKDKVKFLGIRTDTDYIYSAFDYFVFPSLHEGLGIVLIEAQAAGLKCIASKDVIPKEARVTELLEFCPLNIKPEEWAKLIYANGKYERKDTLEQIKKKRYDIREISLELEKFYAECINKYKKKE